MESYPRSTQAIYANDRRRDKNESRRNYYYY